MMSLQSATHSSQMNTRGPEISFRTSRRRFPQNEQWKSSISKQYCTWAAPRQALRLECWTAVGLRHLFWPGTLDFSFLDGQGLHPTRYAFGWARPRGLLPLGAPDTVAAKMRALVVTSNPAAAVSEPDSPASALNDLGCEVVAVGYDVDQLPEDIELSRPSV